MAEEFEDRDLRDAVFWGVDLRGARFRDVHLGDVTITHSRLVDVHIDAEIEHVVINGVDVTDHVNAHDPWYPLRAMLRPSDPDGVRTTWRALQDAWDAAVERAGRLTDDERHASVDGEFSFVETVRHLVFATDKWFTEPVLGGTYHPIGLPNTGSRDVMWPGIDLAAEPSFDEALAVRSDRVARLTAHLEDVTPAELERPVRVRENDVVLPTRECLHVVFEEEFHHLRYALRDLDRLG
jgi:hypothetical protein